MYCRWLYKPAHFLWRAIWQQNLRVNILFDQSILLLRIDPMFIHMKNDKCTRIYTEQLHSINSKRSETIIKELVKQIMTHPKINAIKLWELVKLWLISEYYLANKKTRQIYRYHMEGSWRYVVKWNKSKFRLVSLLCYCIFYKKIKEYSYIYICICLEYLLKATQ